MYKNLEQLYFTDWKTERISQRFDHSLTK